MVLYAKLRTNSAKKSPKHIVNDVELVLPAGLLFPVSKLYGTLLWVSTGDGERRLSDQLQYKRLSSNNQILHLLGGHVLLGTFQEIFNVFAACGVALLSPLRRGTPANLRFSM